ncbi:catalase [Oxynema aestuarii]|uniref:Catalase n=1 Tax=Oxynema aestuarii AP17 TaxID=2064643 RepID=A0A6H1U1Z7_9CYAN|nr:catalase [Oxynema aestuarii]QIZ72851.1 catalase [Oxynema aestuarii AP17]
MSDRNNLTTADGIPVGDNQNSLTAGSRGPVLMQDFHLQEKLAHFNRERIPERVVHAKGAGAFGTFTVTQDITQYSKAKLFSQVGKQTDVLVRFSTVGGEQGSADAERDPRGFAIKFYTEEGNWDLVGNNTFSLINANNERVWCKFHVKTLQGIQNMTAEEAARVRGEDPDRALRDLYKAIARGEYPQWRVSIQVMTEQQAAKHPDNPFDVTKVWKHADYPLIEVGILELNRNPENYFAQIEQAAFSPSAVVPGISFSPDKMLQARIMSYPDAHRYRLGANYQQLPVNEPKCPVMHYQRDGAMALGNNGGNSPNYEPNSYDDAPKQNPAYVEPSLPLGNVEAGHYDHREGNDDYTQAGDLFRLLSTDERRRLIDNIVGSLSQATEEIQKRQLCHFFRADANFGGAIASGLGLEVEMPTR